MMDSGRKKIILIVLAILGLGIVIVCWQNNRKYADYVHVADANEVVSNLNSNFFLMDHNGLSEEEYVKGLSNSLVMGYFYLASLDPASVIFVDSLTDEQMAWFMYFVVSGGSEAVCIDSNFLEELVNDYFGRDKFSFRDSTSGFKYRVIAREYCFEQHFFDYISRMELNRYEVNDDVVILSYEEIFDDSDDINNRSWGIQFKKDGSNYQLVSVYASY